MSRILAFVISCVLLNALLVVAQCPQPPAAPIPCPAIRPDGCPTPVVGGVCTVPLDFFNKFQNCTGGHAPIQIVVGHFLTITSADGTIKDQFSVGSFTKYQRLLGNDCSGISGLADPFDEQGIRNLKQSHKLQAKVKGCYKVNLTLNRPDPNHPHRFCTIDPHIIVSGDNLISPNAVPSDH